MPCLCAHHFIGPAGAAGLASIRVVDGGAIDAAKPIKEGLSDDIVAQLLAASCASPGDLLLLAAGPTALVNRTLDRVRQYLARDLKLINQSRHAMLWVTDFPMFEVNEEENRLEALHHPFTSPNLDVGSLASSL